MEEQLRYRAVCRSCGVLEGRRYVEYGSKRYYVAPGETTPQHLIGRTVKSVWLIFPKGEKPICSSCKQDLKVNAEKWKTLADQVKAKK